MRVIEALTLAPAKLLKLDRGTLKPGSVADIAIVDLDAPFIYSKAEIRSKSKNTAFENARFQGRVLRTIVAGRTVYQRADDRG